MKEEIISNDTNAINFDISDWNSIRRCGQNKKGELFMIFDPKHHGIINGSTLLSNYDGDLKLFSEYFNHYLKHKIESIKYYKDNNKCTSMSSPVYIRYIYK